MADRQRGQVLLAVLLLSGLLAMLSRQMLQAAWLQQHHAAVDGHQLLLDSRLLARIAWLESMPIPARGSGDLGAPWHPQSTIGASWQRCGSWQTSDGTRCETAGIAVPDDWHVQLQRQNDDSASAADAATDASVFASAVPQRWQLDIRARDRRGRVSGWRMRYRQLPLP